MSRDLISEHNARSTIYMFLQFNRMGDGDGDGDGNGVAMVVMARCRNYFLMDLYCSDISDK